MKEQKKHLPEQKNPFASHILVDPGHPLRNLPHGNPYIFCSDLIISLKVIIIKFNANIAMI